MRNKIRFFSTCICILLPLVCLCLYTRLNPLAFMDGEAPFYIWNKEKANTEQEKYYDVLILGDSVANAGYIPALLSDSSLNLALGGTTAMENYYTLQDWLAHHPAPKACFISFMDFHFQREDCFWTRSMYTHRYQPLQNIEMIRAAVKYQEPSVLTEHYLTDYIGYELCLPDKYMTALVNARLNQRYEANFAAKQIGELRGGLHSAGTKDYMPSGEITYADFLVKPMFNDYYRKLIELCLEHDITVHIIKMPLPNNSTFTDEYQEDFSNYYRSLKKEYPAITVNWFSNYEEKCFQDPVHMNYHGALQFSTEVRALFPENFGCADLTLGQAEAINSYIKIENQVNEILKWINGRDYTAIVRDNSGVFVPTYQKMTESETGMEMLHLSQIDIDDINSLYSVSGQSNGLHDFSITRSEHGLEVRIGETAVQEWGAISDNMISVLVIDNYNKNVVCTKNFRYDNSQLILS